MKVSITKAFRFVTSDVKNLGNGEYQEQWIDSPDDHIYVVPEDSNFYPDDYIKLLKVIHIVTYVLDINIALGDALVPDMGDKEANKIAYKGSAKELAKRIIDSFPKN